MNITQQIRLLEEMGIMKSSKSQKKSDEQLRDDEGRYRHSLEKVCGCCGHTNGQHTAARVKGQQPCTVDGCECESFKR